MGLSKAELERHHAQHDVLINSARVAEREGRYRDVLDLAQRAWIFLDGMMQFERRYEDAEFKSVTAVDLVLHYAPLLLQSESLDALAALLKGIKRIDKLASDDLAGRVVIARQRLLDNARLYARLQHGGVVRQFNLSESLGGEQEYWRRVCETWEKMGIVYRTPAGGSYFLTLVTRLDRVCRGKCPACGQVMQLPQRELLEDRLCAFCHQTSSPVLLPAEEGPWT